MEVPVLGSHHKRGILVVRYCCAGIIPWTFRVPELDENKEAFNGSLNSDSWADRRDRVESSEDSPGTVH
jgi:hypothetical protein